MSLKYIGHPILRKKAKTITHASPEIIQIFDILKTIAIERRALGIAAPQIGSPFSIFVTCFPQKTESTTRVLHPPKFFINPKILHVSKETWVEEEGCLSIPDLFAPVKRPVTITLSYQDEFFCQHEETFSGWDAKIILHENDHLNGVLFIDRLSPQLKKANKNAVATIKIIHNPPI